MAVRSKALENFGLNSIATNTPLSELETALVPIYNFHRYQVEAAAKLIAGVDYSYEVKEAVKAKNKSKVKGKVANDDQYKVKAVSAAMQQQALSALLSTLNADFLTLSEDIISLIPPKAYGYSRTRESFASQTGITFDPVTVAQASAKHTLGLLLNHERLARLQQQAMSNQHAPLSNSREQDVDAIFSINELITQLLDKTIKQRPEMGLNLLVQQRVNQQVIDQLLKLWHQNNLVTEVRSEIYASLEQLKEWLDDNNDSRNYKALSAQFVLLEQQIEFSLKNNKKSKPESKIDMPPGSPIGG